MRIEPDLKQLPDEGPVADMEKTEERLCFLKEFIRENG